MRALALVLVLGVAGAALLPSHDALAWRDRWGGWHPNGYVYGAPVPYYAAPVYVAPRPYAYGYGRGYYRGPYYGHGPYRRW
jgi:hypothetical protein